MKEEKVVLISVVGMSPAVVTETIWGLHKEKPELLPDEVVVYTTRDAEKNMESSLKNGPKGGTIWDSLQAAVGKKMKLSVRVFEDENGDKLKDIVTKEDQELVADQLLKGIREYKNPQLEVCRIIASIAGGRKSMSALMYGAMSLGAQADDVITHVLADENASNCPAFFFPAQEQQELTTRSGVAFTAADTTIELAEIPFVPLAALVKKANFSGDGAFSKLVARARRTVEAISPEDTKIRVSVSSCKVYINGQEIALEPAPYTLMAIMATHAFINKDKGTNTPLTYKMANDLLEVAKVQKLIPDAIKKLPKDFTKAKNALKEALLAAGFTEVVADSIRDGRKKQTADDTGLGFKSIHDIKFKK